MPRRVVLVLVLAALVLALRLVNLYAVFGPHVSRTPEGWTARLIRGQVTVTGLSAAAGGADAAALDAGLRNGDVVREAWSIRGEGGEVRTLDDVVGVRSTIRRGESWRLLIERPADGTRHDVVLPTVAADFMPGAYRTRFARLWGTFVIPLAGLATACLLGLGKPSNDQAFVGALMFIAFAATWEVFRPFIPSAFYSWAEMIWAIGYTYIFYLLLHFFLIFPVRSALDRRMPWLRHTLLALLTVYLGAQLLGALTLGTLPRLAAVFGWLANVTAMVPLVAMAAAPVGLAAAVVSYRRTESRDARRRLGILLAATGALFVAFTSEYLRDWLPGIGAEWLMAIFGIVGFAFPLAFTYVVVTDRVFGIGLIIRRGLQYALVSRGFLLVEVALLFTGVVLAMRLLRTFGTDSSSIAGVAAIGAGTIAIGAALMSLNASGMAVIDRRFFRDAYDATRILTDLAHSVRHLVATPDVLLRQSVETVAAALHVSDVAILLRDPSRGDYRVASQHAPAGAARADAADAIPAESPFARYAEQVTEPRDLFAPEAQLEVTEALGASAPRSADSAVVALKAMQPRLLVPMVRDGQPTGLILLGEKRSEEPYSAEDKRLLQSVADQLAVALGYAHLIARMVEQEKIRRDVELAKQVQEKLFPQSSLAVTALDLVGVCRPAREIGGDYYDFVQLGDGCVGLAVGDISGKGIAAALLMASLQALLRSRARFRGRDVSGLVADVNALLYESTGGNKYATFFYGLYDGAARTITYVNAGHVPPIVVRRCASHGSAAVERLTEGGPVIGLFPELQFEQGVVRLCPGDFVVVVTDGVTEAMNAAGEDLGDDRLVAAAHTCLGMTAAATRDHLLAFTDAFVGDAPQHDDLTLVVAVART